MIDNEIEFMEVARSKTQYQEVVLRLREGEDVASVLKYPPQDMTLEQVVACAEKVVLEADKAMAEYDQKVNGDRKGRWNPLYSGRRFWPEDPRPGDVDIIDIAHCLARINRFNGHTYECYSVAQHCVLVASILPAELQLFGLMHDAGECYLGDVITPIKRLLREFYEPLEERVMEVVADRFDFHMDTETKAEVKKADLRLLFTEIRDLCPTQTFNGDMTVAPMRQPLPPVMSPERAELAFLQSFAQLIHG